MDPDAVKSTLTNLAYGNVMAAAARDLQKEMVAKDKAQTSKAAYDEVDLDELMDDPELEKLHAERIAALKKEVEKRQEQKKKGHGEYRDVTEGEFLGEVTSSELLICHFYHHGFYRCKDSDVNDRRAASSNDEAYATHNRQVKFKDPVSSSEVYAADEEGNHNEEEQAGTWVPGPSPYSNTFEDPSSSYPYLQPVPEEPSSSFSEAADDDPLPAIEDLQISGEPYPGRQLQACGFSVNGTTSCNFEWVRHLEDGSVKYIDGAKQPIYLVTADDVDTYLAIEVQPLDDRKRKGELVRVFANEHNKIICDPSMQSHIEQNFYNGHASYHVSLSTNFLDIWEPAILTIKREGYTIKGSGTSGIAINEKFSPGTTVSITHGHDLEFSLFNASGVEHLLRAEDNIADIVSVRDTIVLTLKLFVMKVKLFSWKAITALLMNIMKELMLKARRASRWLKWLGVTVWNFESERGAHPCLISRQECKQERQALVRDRPLVHL